MHNNKMIKAQQSACNGTSNGNINSSNNNTKGWQHQAAVLPTMTVPMGEIMATSSSIAMQDLWQ